MNSCFGTGAYKVCPVCKKAFYCDPECWVYKREIRHVLTAPPINPLLLASQRGLHPQFK